MGKALPTTVLEVQCRRTDATPAQLEVERLSFQMMEHFRAGHMAECLGVLVKMEELRPNDKAVAVMRGKADKLLREGVPEGWQGVTAMNEK